MLFLASLACIAVGDDAVADSTDTASVQDDFHPLVPEGYEYLWNTEGCDDGKARTYILGEGFSQPDGTVSFTEQHFRFYGDADDDWEDDCVDLYAYSGSPLTRSELNNLEASTFEEGYETERTLLDGGCDAGWASGDAEILWAFDTLTEAGELNFENRMLVVQFAQGWGGEDWRADLDYARGEFNPLDQVLGPPASYTWEGGGGCGW